MEFGLIFAGTVAGGFFLYMLPEVFHAVVEFVQTYLKLLL